MGSTRDGLSTERAPRIWLRPAEGPWLRVRARGLLFGRGVICDVVLSERQASRVQTLVRSSMGGLEVIAIGALPTTINGASVDRIGLAANGDWIEMPGGRWQVVAEEIGSQPRWRLALDGRWYGLKWFPFTIGGASGDHLRAAGWPPNQLRFAAVRDGLALEVGEGTMLNGEPLRAGDVELIEPGDWISFRGIDIHLERDSAPATATLLASDARIPIGASLQFQPSGGRFELSYLGGESARVDLPELRARLIAALINEPGWLEDEDVITAVWGARSERGRTDLNLLIHHTRKALARADIDPALLERSRQGGGTRFLMAPGARITVV